MGGADQMKEIREQMKEQIKYKSNTVLITEIKVEKLYATITK